MAINGVGRTFMGRIGTSRKWVALVSAAAAAVALATFGVTSAQAVHDTGAFELDGNATHQTTDDWDNVCHQVDPSACPNVSNTNGATAVSWTAEPDLNATIFTGGGSKDPQDISSWAWKDGAGGLPDKDNLLHSFAARYSLPPNATHCPSGTASTCELLFFGSDRYDNSGDAQQGFWFFQNAVSLGTNSIGGGSGFVGTHRDGDILVISDFSNGGTTSTITVYAWDHLCLKAGDVVGGKTCGDANLKIMETSTAANCATASSGDSFCGITNTSDNTAVPWSFTDKSGNSTYLQGEFFEGGINLSTIGLAGECFASVASETRSSTSTTATLKDFILGRFGNCGSGLVTTPKDGAGASIPAAGLSIGTGSVQVKDSAQLTITGTSTWSGSLQFSLCGPLATGTCDTGGVAVGSAISVSQSTTQPILSSAATLTSAGRYCWRGDFTASATSKTAGVPDASDHSTGECFTVNPVTPTLSTAAGAGPVTLGNAVYDQATISGTATKPGTNGPSTTYPSINATNGAAAGGTITFTLSGPSTTSCGSLVFTSTGTTISGDGTYPAAPGVSFTPTTAGTYHWAASYSGDSPNTNSTTHNTLCTDTAEDVVVSAAGTSVATHQFVYPQDKAVISATTGGNLAGSVQFKLYDSLADCQAAGTTGLLYSPTSTSISGASPQSATTNNTTVLLSSNATVYWQVTYTSTNTNQNGSSSSCSESTQVTYAGNDSGVTIP